MEAMAQRRFFVLNGFISVVAVSFLAWLLFLHSGLERADVNLRFLPPLNAGLNGTAAVLLVAGRVAIIKKRADIHRTLMLAAFAASACFLVSYVVYHAVHGDTKFGGEGVARTLYLALLSSHVMLSVPIVPMALTAFWFAKHRRFEDHKKVTRWLHPLWLYVSATGVLVFVMLRPYYPA